MNLRQNIADLFILDFFELPPPKKKTTKKQKYQGLPYLSITNMSDTAIKVKLINGCGPALEYSPINELKLV